MDSYRVFRELLPLGTSITAEKNYKELKFGNGYVERIRTSTGPALCSFKCEFLKTKNLDDDEFFEYCKSFFDSAETFIIQWPQRNGEIVEKRVYMKSLSRSYPRRQVSVISCDFQETK